MGITHDSATAPVDIEALESQLCAVLFHQPRSAIACHLEASSLALYGSARRSGCNPFCRRIAFASARYAWIGSRVCTLTRSPTMSTSS